MKNTIVNAYQWILYVGMAFWIISSTYAGYSLGGYLGEDEAAGLGVLGFLMGVITSVFFLGFVFVIIQIRDLLQDLVNIHKGTEKWYLDKDGIPDNTQVWGDSALIKCPHCNEHNNVNNYSPKAFLRCKKCQDIIQKGFK